MVNTMIQGVKQTEKTGEDNVINLNAGDLKTLQDLQNISPLLSRYFLAMKNGLQFSGDRNLNDVLGYKKALSANDFYHYYRRDPFARRIVNAYPNATWRAIPRIMEDEDKDRETKFEKAVNDIAGRLKLWNYCKRFDRLAGIGRYAVMVLGYGDAQPMEKPLTPGKPLLWLRTVSEELAQIEKLESDPASPRYGLPEFYKITLNPQREGVTVDNTTTRVHHSRVIHYAWDLLEDDVYGVPFLEAVVDRIFDLQKVVGGSAEMYWLGARNGMQFVADDGGQITNPEKLKTEAEEYMHQLRRMLAVTGGKWETFENNFQDPKGAFDVLVASISVATEIPVRVLLGSERGELASGQDETNWNNVIKERRNNTASMGIIKPLINHMIVNRVLPAPQNTDWGIDWDSNDDMSPKDQAEINKSKAESLSKYSSSPGAEMVVPREEFREKFLGLPAVPEGGFPEDIDDDLPEVDGVDLDDDGQEEIDGQA